MCERAPQVDNWDAKSIEEKIEERFGRLWDRYELYPDVRGADRYARNEPLELYTERRGDGYATTHIGPALGFYLWGARGIPNRSDIRRAISALREYQNGDRMQDILMSAAEGTPLGPLARKYRISPGRVSQIKAQAIRHLRQQLAPKDA